MTEHSPSPVTRILIVDDHRNLRLLVRETLDDGQSNYTFQEAANGQEALQALTDFRPTVVILDVMLPGGMDGYQICRFIKASDKEIPAFVIMLTACGQRMDEEKGKAAGADLYLTKPFSPIQLAAAVRKIAAGQVPDNP